ncbi:MAG: helix-turn-helix domain-containing protein [Epsilonproteobacteria bacterium]|nr:helix-turn-helix domain-containing protein [Campylobacterota bacterium]
MRPTLKMVKQKPSKKLSRYIDTYWMIENHTNRSIDLPIVPDGCIDIVVKDSDIFLVGLMEVASIKPIYPCDAYFGIRFHPAVMTTLLQRDISTFNDKIAPLSSIDSNLYRVLAPLLSHQPYDFIALDKQFELLFESVTFDMRILDLVEMIVLSGGSIEMEALEEQCGLSSRQIERLFHFHVGLTPKKFARIMRFFDTHKYLTKEGIDNLCLKVLHKGYYDQAHFNREYKALTGIHPTSEVMSIFYNTK